MWFEELPPASPAPSTIGVLEEGEGEEGMEDDRPRWGRKPMVSVELPSQFFFGFVGVVSVGSSMGVLQ